MAGDSSRFAELVKHGEMSLSLGKVDELRVLCAIGAPLCTASTSVAAAGPPAPAPPKAIGEVVHGSAHAEAIEADETASSHEIVGGKIGELGRGTTEVTEVRWEGW